MSDSTFTFNKGMVDSSKKITIVAAKWNGDLVNVRGMQLWNDWNLQVFKANRHDKDYMLVRSF